VRGANEKEARKTEITIGSLFDGIGGFPLAGQRNGMTALWASEIEPFPIKVTKIRFPNMKHLGDITKIDCNNLEPVDIVTGGSPCQDLSVAGKRAGLAGARSGLFMEQIRIVRELREIDKRSGRTGINIRPRFMVWENVPGAFSSNKGEDFRAVLEETARIADKTAAIPGPPKGKWNTVGAIMGNGWSIAWRVLDAQYWGVPQRRRRIFLVADFGGQSAPEILFKRQGLSRYLAESREARKRVATDAEGSTSYAIQLCGDRKDPGVSVSEKAFCIPANPMSDRGQAVCAERSVRKAICNEIAGTLDSCYYKGCGMAIVQGYDACQHHNWREADKLGPMTTGVGRVRGDTPLVAYGIQGSMIGRADKNGPQGNGINEDVSFTLNTTDRHAVAFACNQRDEVRDMKDKSGALQAQPGMKQQTFIATKVYGICSYASNSMKSDNPHSGIYEAETSRTLDLNGGSPACNQGGMAIVQTYSFQRSDEYKETDEASTQSRRQYKAATDLVVSPTYALDRASFNQGKNAHSDMLVTPYQETVGSLCARDYKGIGNQYVSEDKCIIAPKYSVRRLTPLECERLQGFPDGWTDIPGASDSARYKALGNSVAIPCVEYVLEGIKEVLEVANEK